ncbi:MAG: L,D-transpeptidase family protein [Actinomycetota bacterium]
MTDLATAPGAETGASDAPTAPLSPDDNGPDRPVEWAPQEPAPRKRRVGLWIGIGAGVLLLGAGAVSTILIAPGTTVAGIPIGGLTPGAASEVLSTHLASTEITLTDVPGDVVVTGADLGAAIDATALADEAFASHPMWNVTTWMSEPIPADITLDAAAAESVLRASVPSSYVDPVNASVVFDKGEAEYVVVPSEPGTAVDVDALTVALTDAVGTGAQTASFSGAPTEALAPISDEDAQTMATSMNEMLESVGFYVGDSRTVPVRATTVANWLSAVEDDGALRIAADQTEIQKVVDMLPGRVDRDPVNARNVVDSGGEVLRELTEGVNGRELGDTSSIASDFAAQLETGDASYQLEVTETDFKTTEVFRRIEVDLGAQRTYLFENDKVVNSWAISSGTSATPTDVGNFRVYAHLSIQDMRGTNPDGSKYVTENVPWVTYFNGDEAFHGAYWHSNFGTPMSHGCVNMPVDAAKYLYEWAPLGLEVSVHH